jgi:hypothetical protein
MSVLAVSFLPLAIVPGPQRFGVVAAVAALLVTAALLAVGTAAVFPFEMDTVVSLAEGRLVATHYGFYNTVVGIGILGGNLATGAVVGAAHAAGVEWAVWVGLGAVGAVGALALHGLDRSDRAQRAVAGGAQGDSTRGRHVLEVEDPVEVMDSRR